MLDHITFRLAISHVRECNLQWGCISTSHRSNVSKPQHAPDPGAAMAHGGQLLEIPTILQRPPVSSLDCSASAVRTTGHAARTPALPNAKLLPLTPCAVWQRQHAWPISALAHHNQSTGCHWSWPLGCHSSIGCRREELTHKVRWRLPPWPGHLRAPGVTGLLQAMSLRSTPDALCNCEGTQTAGAVGTAGVPACGGHGLCPPGAAAVGSWPVAELVDSCAAVEMRVSCCRC